MNYLNIIQQKKRFVKNLIISNLYIRMYFDIKNKKASHKESFHWL